jgi:hypothetical protein
MEMPDWFFCKPWMDNDGKINFVAVHVKKNAVHSIQSCNTKHYREPPGAKKSIMEN